jgi:hypothetical protein
MLAVPLFLEMLICVIWHRLYPICCVDSVIWYVWLLMCFIRRKELSSIQILNSGASTRKPKVSWTKRKQLSLLLSGYRHVYLEGLTEASIFVHITINEIYGKVRRMLGLKAAYDSNCYSTQSWLANRTEGMYVVTSCSLMEICREAHHVPPTYVLSLLWGGCSFISSTQGFSLDLIESRKTIILSSDHLFG